MSVSQAERSYVQDSLAQDYRLDGRSRLDFRALQLAVGVAPAAHGSARCRLGGTDIIATCRLEVEEVSHGSLDVSVECTPAALAALDQDVAFSLSGHLQALFARSLDHHPQLSILPGRRAWVVSLHVTIFSADGGNLLDAVSIAARSALVDLRIPRTRAIGHSSARAPGTSTSDSMASLLKPGTSIKAKGGSRALDFELESYHDAGDALKDGDDLPISVTLNLLGDLQFVDATLQEERVAPSRLVVGTNRHQHLRLVRQEGELEVDADVLDRLLDIACPLAVELIDSLTDSQSPTKDA